MTRGRSILRAAVGVIMSALFFLSIIAFFVMPIIKDREARAMLDDPDAFVTDTARDPWIYVDENGVAMLNSDRCLGMEEIVIPDAVNGVTVTSFDMHYYHAPDWVKKVTFPSTLRTIAAFPFHQWDGIEEIVFQEGVEDLSLLVIGQKEHLRKLVLPRSVKAINAGIFSYKEHPVEICYAGTEEEWLALGSAAEKLSAKHTVIYEYGAEN